MKKKICLILILLLTLIIVPVGAKSKDNFIADDDVKVTKSIGATTFVAGNTVNVNSEIDGALFAAGNNVSLTSSEDILFAAGNNVTVESVITKDAFLAGSSVNIQASTIRDLYAAASNIRVDSDIMRNAYLGGDTVIINSKINGDVEIAADTIKLGEGAEIVGTLNYPEDAKLDVAEGAIINKKTTYEVEKINTETMFMTSVLDRVYAFLGMLLIGIILMALNKKVFTKIGKINKDLNTFAKEFGMGFVFLVVVPVAAIIAMCTVIGLPLAIISLMIYGIMIYLSVIPTAYYLGNAFLKDKIKNEFFVFAISLLVIYLLRVIPVIGGLVTFISLCFGLGVYTELLKSNIKTK